MTGASLLRVSSLAAGCLLAIMAGTAQAQTDAGISIAGIVSLQPVDDSWVGSPYLDEGVGGIQPGIAAGVDIVFANGLVVLGEFSTTRTFEQFQSGRLVGFNNDNLSREGSATARLRDTLIHALAGYAASGGSSRVTFAGGISGVLTTLTQEGVPVDESDFEPALEGRRYFALTGGIDFQQQLSSRASLLITTRYSWLGRSENADQTGAGAHIFRIGAGVRIGLGR
jgi:hypothetical protein